MIKTQEELLRELLQEVQETRRYAVELHNASNRVITLVDRLLESVDTSEEQDIESLRVIKHEEQHGRDKKKD